MKEAGLWPDKFSREDRFINPANNVITTYDLLQPHQRRIALWVPSLKKLNQVLRDRSHATLEVKDVEGVHLAYLRTAQGPMSGIGVGQTEALLSLLNRMRSSQLALSCS